MIYKSNIVVNFLMIYKSNKSHIHFKNLNICLTSLDFIIYKS